NTDLASGASPSRRAKILDQQKTSLFGGVLNGIYFGLEEAWQAPDLGPSFRQDFYSEVPTLLLSGSLDMNTPPHQAERLRWNLPNATHIVVKNAGHEQTLFHPEIGPSILKFLRGEDVSGTVAAYPPLKFVPLTGNVEGASHPAADNDAKR
ncbi:MAG: alpha/beta hydrolase, partial [Bacteroidota bacterium]